MTVRVVLDITDEVQSSTVVWMVAPGSEDDPNAPRFAEVVVTQTVTVERGLNTEGAVAYKAFNRDEVAAAKAGVLNGELKSDGKGYDLNYPTS